VEEVASDNEEGELDQPGDETEELVEELNRDRVRGARRMKDESEDELFEKWQQSSLR
jgi:hypothetical protein